MDQKTVGIIATIVSVVLCGCPGLALLCTGALASGGTFIPDADIEDPEYALIGGLLMLCIGVLMLLIPVAVGFFTMRNRTGPASSQIIDYDDPLPPAI